MPQPDGRGLRAPAAGRRPPGGGYRVAGAGAEPRRVHPSAVTAMAEVGVDISDHTAKAVDPELPRSASVVVTLRGDAGPWAAPESRLAPWRTHAGGRPERRPRPARNRTAERRAPAVPVEAPRSFAVPTPDAGTIGR